MNTVIVVLKRACECVKIADMCGNIFSFRIFCADGESKELHRLIISPTDAETLSLLVFSSS